MKENRMLEVDQVLSLGSFLVSSYSNADVTWWWRVCSVTERSRVLLLAALQPHGTTYKCLPCSGSRPGEMQGVTTGRSTAIQTDAKSDMQINSM